jgi:hypothetical protein
MRQFQPPFLGVYMVARVAAWLKTKPSAPRCLGLSRGRFPIEQFFQRDKTDLGLDHYEGRSWLGLHHHLALAAVAYLFGPPVLVVPGFDAGFSERLLPSLVEKVVSAVRAKGRTSADAARG